MAYRRARGLTPAAAASIVDRVVASAGIHLAHRAIAAVMAYGTLSASTLCTLQIACRFLAEPDDAARGLLP